MGRVLTADTINGSSSCPLCGKGDRLNLKALVDSDLRSYASWLVCGHCGWDQRAQQGTIPHGQ